MKKLTKNLSLNYKLRTKNYCCFKNISNGKYLPLIEYGHKHFGENKVQEALNKWSEVKLKNKNIKLHMIGRLQTNKANWQLVYLIIFTLWIA